MGAKYIKIMSFKADSPLLYDLDLKTSREKIFGKWLYFTDQQKNGYRPIQMHDLKIINLDLYLDAYLEETLNSPFLEHYEKGLIVFNIFFMSFGQRKFLDVWNCHTDEKKWYQTFINEKN